MPAGFFYPCEALRVVRLFTANHSLVTINQPEMVSLKLVAVLLLLLKDTNTGGDGWQLQPELLSVHL